MFQRFLNDLVKFIGVITLLGIGTIGLYIAVVAYQLCQVDTGCPLFNRTQTTPTETPFTPKTTR